MNILIYSEYFLPSIGGVQTATELLARGLVESSKHEVSNDLGSIEITVVTNTSCGEMDDSKLPYRVVRKPKFWELARLVREADLVHLAGPCFLPMLMGWAASKPYVVVHHVYQAVCPNGLLLKYPSQKVCGGHFMRRQYAECFRCCSRSDGGPRAIRALLLQFPRRWLCTRAAANVMITAHVGARVQMPRSRTIYHGIDDLHPSAIQKGTNGSEVIQFGYVGRLVAEKGLSLLLEAARHLAGNGGGFRLTFIGDGPERARLETLVKLYGLRERVEFMGDMRGMAFERAASQIAVVIMPSIWEETAGLAAIEQMMRGRLVIAADIGGLGEVVDDAGLKFVPGDWRSLAAWMRRVIDDPSLVVSLGATARARAMRYFGGERMIGEHVSLYREVVRQKGRTV